ncbi:RE1-silencing transcription factor-like 3 [Homarus americanus]|uniref:RE1-silencing transcription factor-like 3 n=1 Tax=Homarus americanus TaxID=6706 RepID=A0A8J5MW73_HOMAM|nr:RE1-silencing transcription factor-like 3 [Homarus americanus]
MGERAVLITGGAVGSSYKTSFICAVCHKSFNHRGNFMKHYRTHTGEKPFQCTKCPYKATQKAHLTTHMLGRHGELLQSSMNKVLDTIHSSLTTHHIKQPDFHH